MATAIWFAPAIMMRSCFQSSCHVSIMIIKNHTSEWCELLMIESRFIRCLRFILAMSLMRRAVEVMMETFEIESMDVREHLVLSFDRVD